MRGYLRQSRRLCALKQHERLLISLISNKQESFGATDWCESGVPADPCPSCDLLRIPQPPAGMGRALGAVAVHAALVQHRCRQTRTAATVAAAVFWPGSQQPSPDGMWNLWSRFSITCSSHCDTLWAHSLLLLSAVEVQGRPRV